MAANIKVKVLTDRDDIVAIADAVRNQTGLVNLMTLHEIAKAVENMDQVAIWDMSYSLTDVPLITFTIDGTIYRAEEGMTWSAWMISDYNTTGAFNFIVADNEGYWVASDVVIVAGTAYTKLIELEVNDYGLTVILDNYTEEANEYGTTVIIR
jgi:hypothetical protein